MSEYVYKHLDTLPLWSVAEGEAARDAAQARVLSQSDDFRIKAADIVCRELAGQEVLAEVFRKVCVKHGVTPHHHNAWGALTGYLCRAGLIEDTGRIDKSADPRSHARRQPVWRVRSSGGEL